MQVLIGRKKNMTTRFDSRGNAVPVTVIFASPNLIVGHRQPERDGYSALQLGFEAAKKPKNPQKKGYKDLKFVPKIVREFRVNPDEGVDASVGTEITVADFSSGDVLKVTGTSRGKGFTGVVKRWGFAGGPRTHGQSDRERAPGSIGQTTTPGRVYKGKKMAGHSGNASTTVSGITVYDVDKENNLILVKGALPGPSNSLLLIEKIGSRKPLVEASGVEEEAKVTPEVEIEGEQQASENNTTEEENVSEGQETQPNEPSVEAVEAKTEGESVEGETSDKKSADSPAPSESEDQPEK